ncbi:MAG: PhzF family phenazine biosynthesis protein [Gammaproteobacteria bacterium]|nr:PhzF family phenazine biosynthesis protein [Gammaproteobacteria bacterium]NIR85117.1 PhzF family phenazine biosynthesis protein [Gammaproteobacteria bacterium]NIR92046.1 PhzF family phenazine biosynthesis protein [Gammaproteobacteria bacterium]NIU06166.1 PhzF family phenazine biosynthesis protein [Gammaproteobacteria bacterium]NIV53165.1 PhzF family phenazine biosynthesis isomerase [Gammaproteobacteria bacterium]
MPTYPFMQVDAFTDRPLAGNACAVVFDADALDQGTMLALAREMNLSETAFVLASSIADFRARYFTPAEEIPLAGHPTIATVFALVHSGRLRPAAEHTRITLELAAGVISVAIEARSGNPVRVTMTQRKPRFLATYTPTRVMPLFGLRESDARDDVPIQTVSTGTPQLMIPVRSLEALRRAHLDIRGYAEFRASADFFSPHLFCLEGATPAGRTFARHFGTPPDTLEDPFTGSATGGMAAYLWRYRLIDEPRFVAEQGHWMNRPGRAEVEVVGPRADMETVRVGGSAVAILEGRLTL